jgi:hypothetical protein
MVNRIEAIKGRTKYLGAHLVIAVDGVPLDQRLHAAFQLPISCVLRGKDRMTIHSERVRCENSFEQIVRR